MMCVEHVTGEEKYDCDILNVVVMESRMFCGRVCCDSMNGIFLDFCVCIFGRVILLLFQMVVCGVLAHLCCEWHYDIVAITILFL